MCNCVLLRISPFPIGTVEIKANDICQRKIPKLSKSKTLFNISTDESWETEDIRVGVQLCACENFSFSGADTKRWSLKCVLYIK